MIVAAHRRRRRLGRRDRERRRYHWRHPRDRRRRCRFENPRRRCRDRRRCCGLSSSSFFRCHRRDRRCRRRCCRRLFGVASRAAIPGRLDGMVWDGPKTARIGPGLAGGPNGPKVIIF